MVTRSESELPSFESLNAVCVCPQRRQRRPKPAPPLSLPGIQKEADGLSEAPPALEQYLAMVFCRRSLWLWVD